MHEHLFTFLSFFSPLFSCSVNISQFSNLLPYSRKKEVQIQKKKKNKDWIGWNWLESGKIFSESEIDRLREKNTHWRRTANWVLSVKSWECCLYSSFCIFSCFVYHKNILRAPLALHCITEFMWYFLSWCSCNLIGSTIPISFFQIKSHSKFQNVYHIKK